MRSSMPSEDGLYGCPHPAIKRKLDKIWKYHKGLAMANSHSKACIRLGDGSFKKWCAACGSEFTTVNETRSTCADCQEKIFGEEARDKEKKKAKRREERLKAEERRKKQKKYSAT